jgi:NAD(P)H-hydrate epimerase
MPVPVINLEQMREWEKVTWAGGQTEAEVIRQVGLCVARCALDMTKPSDRILILAGKGHNGDDARAARPHLQDRRVDVLELVDPQKDLTSLTALLSLKPSLLIDGLFGIGINRPLSAAWVTLINHINDAHLKILAVDVPSGLDVSTGQPQGAAVRATLTLTVGAPKLGMLGSTAWEFVGRLKVAGAVGLAELALSTELQWTTRHDFLGFPPERVVSGHKGTYGHLSVIAGSLGYHGAAVLTARGAQRAQPGLVTLYTLDSVYSVVASQLQAVMVSPWRGDTAALKNRTALLIGPGLAAPDVPEQIKSLVTDVWRDFPGPVVVDASALAWISPECRATPGIRVITPHPGEAARLLEKSTSDVQSDRLQAVRDLSQRFSNTWVILKGHQTVVGRNEGAVFVNSSGNPHLAQGGSGDVLSGYLAGLLAQPVLQRDPFLALRYGVWQHGAAADLLAERQRNWIVEELVAILGQA